MPPSFQFNAKRIFLTYAQVDDLNHEHVLRLLDNLGVIQRILGIERHSDDGIHFHVLAEWEKAFRTRDPRAFDVEGRHPNISGVRDVRAVYNYVTKDHDVHGEFVVSDKKRKRDDVFREACASANCHEFLRIIEDGCPRDRVIFANQIETYANKRYKAISEPYQPVHTDFNLPDDLAKWVAEEFPKVEC